MAQAEEVPVLSEAYLTAIAYLSQYNGVLSGLCVMKSQLDRGEDLSDKQVAYVIRVLGEDTEY